MSPPPPMMMYIAPPLFLLAVDDGVEDHLRANLGRAERLQPKLTVRFLANGVINPAHHFFHLEPFFSDLAGHDVAVISIRYSYEDIRLLDSGAIKYIFVNTVAYMRRSAKIGAQALEGIAAGVND